MENKFSVETVQVSVSTPTERESAVSMRLINYIDCASPVDIWNGLQLLLTGMLFQPLIFCAHK